MYIILRFLEPRQQQTLRPPNQPLREDQGDAARLQIDPAPDTLIRVFMAYRPLKAPQTVPPQTLTAPRREGFTVVEWGGALVR